MSRLQEEVEVRSCGRCFSNVWCVNVFVSGSAAVTPVLNKQIQNIYIYIYGFILQSRAG